MTTITYKPLITMGDSIRATDKFGSNKSVESIIAAGGGTKRSTFEFLVINRMFLRYESSGCNPIIIDPNLIKRPILTSPYHVSGDIKLMSSPLAVILPEKYSIPSFFSFVGKLKDLKLDLKVPESSKLVSVCDDLWGDEPVFVCWYDDICNQILPISKLNRVFQSRKKKNKFGAPDDYRAIWDMTMNIVTGIENNRFVLDNNIPKGLKYRQPNSITGHPSVKCVMMKDRTVKQECTVSNNDSIKDQINRLRKELGESKVSIPVSKVKQKSLLRELQLKLDKKLEIEKKKTIDSNKSNNVDADKVTSAPIVSKPKLQQQTKEHISPKEYVQFVDLVIEFKESGYSTRDAIYEACLDMNRSIVDPATFYRWKDVVEKEREKGSELITDEEADKLKEKLETNQNLDSEIKTLQDSLGMVLDMPRSFGEKEACLSMLKQLNDSIPKIKYLRKSIRKYAARVGVHVDESRITGRKPTYDYLQELKQEYLQNKNDIVKPKASVINKPYCANRECPSKVDYHNTLCYECKSKNINIEVPIAKICATEGCSEKFTTSTDSDRMYCAICLTERSNTIGDEVIMSKPGVSDFVEYFLLYLTEDYGLMDSIHEAAAKANVQEPDDLYTIATWCKKYGEPIGETKVSETGRVYRNGMLRSKFASCYLEILSLGKHNKSESCKILSDIMGTELVIPTLANNWVNEFELTNKKEKVDAKSKTNHSRVDGDETVVKVFIQSASREEIKMLSELVDTRKKELLKDLEEEIKRLESEREQYFK